MNDKTVDARGLSCPQPVILTQKMINENNTEFSISVNSVVSRENVMRCVNKNKMNCKVIEQGDDYIIHVTK